MKCNIVLEFMLPYPPTINTYYRVFKNRILISAKGRSYRKEVIALMAGNRNKFSKDDRLIVNIFANMPDKRRRDIDNICKATLDSLQHAGVYHDDCQIDKLIIERGEVVKNGKLNVQIRSILLNNK